VAERTVAPAPAPAPTQRKTSTDAPAQLSAQPLGSPPAGLPPPLGRLLAAPGPGEQLPTSVRRPISERLGIDANVVRVHTDDSSVAAASSIKARAFAYGTHIFLGPGQKPTDLGLMAHEVAHVVQQDGRATIQRSAMSGAVDGLEMEARSAGTAVARGERATVVGRTGGPRIQGSFFGSIVSGIKAVGSAIADLGKAAWDAALNFIKDKGRSIPGYDLLSFILGKDPITQQPVERSAMNLIKGLVGLIPGGSAMFENIQKAGVLQKIADWFSTEVEKLNLSWPVIRGLFEQAWNALSASDILSPSTAWEKIKKIFGPPVGRLVDFAVSAGKKLLEFIFEGAIALGGGAAQQVLGFFRRVQSVFGLIVAEPVKFFSNLVAAAKGGFQKFADNIVEHLKKALFNWLFGALAGAIKLPAKFDFMGIIDIVLQVLGLTYERFRERLVKLLGEPAVGYLEKAFEFLKTLVTKGIAAAWEKLLEFASGMIDTVIGMIRDYVVKTIVGKAVIKLIGLFNPIGAIIQAIIGIYDTVMFFIEKAKEVAVLLNAILDSVENIAKGNISGAIAYVEKMLASALVVLINFLARFAGLSKIADAIKDTIKKIQDTVWKAIDKAIDWVKTKVKDLLGKKDAKDAGAKPALPEKQFSAGEEGHRLFFVEKGGKEVLMIASTAMDMKSFLDDYKKTLTADELKSKKPDLDTVSNKSKEADDLADQIEKLKEGDAKLPILKGQLGDAELALTSALKRLLEDVPLTEIDKRYELEGLVGTYGSMPRQAKDKLTPDHQPQNALMLEASSFAIFRGTTLGSYSTSKGWSINLQESRHMEGRTWGSSKTSKAALAEGIKAITDARRKYPDDRDKARAEVVKELKGQLGKDANEMDKVAGWSDKVVWADIYEKVKKPDKRNELIGKIRARIVAGETRIRNQPLERYLE